MLNNISYGANAVSKINGLEVVYFSASLNNNGNKYTLSTTKNIVNLEAYGENKEECENDYSVFEDKIQEFVNELNMGVQNE